MFIIVFFWIIGSQVSCIFRIIFGSFNEVFVHDPHQCLIVIEAKLVEERLPDLIDVTHHHTREENLRERHHGVQGGLDGGLEKFTGVIVEEESSGDDGSKDYDGPEDTPVHVGVRGETGGVVALSRLTSGGSIFFLIWMR